MTAGPYRFTRNPFYLANLLIDLGLCCLIGRIWVAVPYVVLWVLAYRDTIAREELRLASLFPDAYARYVETVPRLIPTGRGLSRSEAAGRFSLANPALVKGSEYARIAGVWVAAATIVAWGWIGDQGLEVFAAQNTAGLGLVMLVPVSWIVKLALAELFRRPETALLPFAGEPSGRRLVTLALVGGLYFTARSIDSSPHSLTASVALVAMIGAIAVLPYAKESHLRRGLLHAGLAVSIPAFAASRGVLWCASVPLVWTLLSALDVGAVARTLAGEQSPQEAPSAARPLWSKFKPIAMLTPVGTAIVALLRRLVAEA